MTGLKKKPLRLRASRLDGGAPSPLPFIPTDIYESLKIEQKQN
jgi:hypothetical protein